MPLGTGDPRLLAILREHADAQLKQWQAKEDLVELTGFFITLSLETEDAGAEPLARMLHMITRTLNRHLRQHGTTYKELRAEVIEELGKQLLANTDASTTAIGGKLG